VTEKIACNAVEAVEQVDHGESLVYEDRDFSVDFTPDMVQALNSIAYFNGSLGSFTLDDLDLPDSLTDEERGRYQALVEDDINDVLSSERIIGDETLLEGIDIERLKETAEDCSLSEEQVETAIEIEKRVTGICDAADVEMPIQEGHAACTTVAACIGAVVALVVAGAVYQTVALYTTAAATVVATAAIGVNTFVGTGHY